MEYLNRYKDTLHPEVVERQPLFITEPEEKGEIPLPKPKSRKKKAEKPAVSAPEPASPPEEETLLETIRQEEPPGILRTAAGIAYTLSPEDSPRSRILSLLKRRAPAHRRPGGCLRLPVGELLQTLTELELEGAVEALSGSRFRLAR